MAVRGKDIFISYSHKDQVATNELTSLVEEIGYTVWIDRSSIKGATIWRKEIAEGIRDCRLFIVLLSPYSVVSDAVLQEIAYAVKISKPILPIYLGENVPLPIELEFVFARLQHIGISSKEDTINAIQQIIGKKRKSAKGKWQSAGDIPVIQSNSQFIIHAGGQLKRDKPLKPTFKISGAIHVTALAFNPEKRSPDIRFLLKPEGKKLPQFLIIFPWELTELNPELFECHFDIIDKNGSIERILQTPICNVLPIPFTYTFELSLYSKNLTFSTSLFKEPLTMTNAVFEKKGYPIRSLQHFQISPLNCDIILSELRIVR